MSSRINSFGCSFTAGADLSDSFNETGLSQLTWPALVAKKFNRGYLCRAYSGIGNMGIAHMIFNKLQSRDREQLPFLWIINWTYVERFDFYPGDPAHIPYWSTLRPGDTSDTADFYFRHLHSELRDKLSTLICMQSVISSLEQHHIPFLMTSIDNTLFGNQYHCPPFIHYLQNQVRPYLYDFDGYNFLDWSRIKGYRISANNHPLEDAHAAAADLMMPIIESILHTT